MGKNITWLGASYTGVEQVELPQTGGGTALFIDSESVVTYYTGSTAPAYSLGQDGDIYLQE